MKLNELDKRICDCEPDATNTQTYREFITNGYMEIFGVKDLCLDCCNEEQLNNMVEELDYLLEK